MTATTRNKATLAVFALMLAPAFGHAETAQPTAQSAPAATASVIAPIPVVLASRQVTVPAVKVEEFKETDVWGRIRTGYAIPDINNALVAKHVNYYSSRPEYLARISTRANRYMFHVVQELEKRNMPTELALLPFIESAFNPQALSTAKAAGMWQFMAATGRDFNLKQNMFQDERRDVLASTDAALNYLEKLYGMFGDWQLALAAYNWGEGNVQKAIKKNQALGKPTDFESLAELMPAETRNYVPKLQAVKNIIANPAAYGVKLPEIPDHPYFVTVTTSRDIDVALAAKLANMPLDEFKALNPSFNRPVILGAANPQILLPFDNAERFQYNLNTYRGGLSSWTAVTVDSRERVEALAARLNVDVDTLREINRIPKGMRLKAGSTVMIPRTERHDQDISASLVDTAMLVVEPDVPDAKRVVVKAGRKDTVATVARRYGVSTRQVQSWNKLSGSKLVAGQSLVLMLRPNSAAAARAERGDDGDDAPAHSAKGRGKAQASTKATKSEAADKSAKVEKSGKAGKAEPRKRVVVEATPHKAAAKAAPVKAASTAKTKTTHAR